MLDAPWGRVRSLAARLGRLERRQLRYVRRRAEETSTLLHVSILLFVPLLVGVLTYLSNQIEGLSFLLFPPLAAGTYTLFADPESRQADPVRFVGGLTAGAVCAWIAVWVAVTFVYPDLAPGALVVDAPGAAFAVFLTGVVTWALGLEEAAAFAVALLGLLVPVDQQWAYVASVLVGSSIVAAVFVAWRTLFYERRATYLYASTTGDDRVLVPMRGPDAGATAMLGARLAAAHDAGKVVLLDVVDEEWQATAQRALLADADRAETELEAAVQSATDRLEARSRRIEAELGVACQVIVAVRESSAAATVLDAARRADCDLVAVPYEAEGGAVTPFVRDLFRGHVDVLVHRSWDGKADWSEVMVPVRGASDVAHSMLDFATRLAGDGGRISLAHCIPSEDRRRRANRMLEDLAETYEGHVETRVARASIDRFLARNAPDYDLVFVGASRDRSAASRLLSPPTFERVQDVETDVAIVDRH